MRSLKIFYQLLFRICTKVELSGETTENPEEKLCGCKDDGSRI